MKILALVIALSTTISVQSTKIPLGPTVHVFSKAYHVESCPRLRGQEAQTTSLYQAIKSLLSPCSECRPNENGEIRSYVSNNTAAIGREADAAREAVRVAGPFMRVTERDARRIVALVVKDLADTTYDQRARDLERSGFRVIFAMQAQEVSPDFTGDPVDLYRDDSLDVVLFGPATTFSFTVAENLRKLEPVSAIWRDVVSIAVSPRSISSPDIEKVVLRRNGVAVAPLSSTLKQTVMTTRMGASFTVHAGILTYPYSAFAPTVDNLDITLIPAIGDNTVKRFTRADLRKIQ